MTNPWRMALMAAIVSLGPARGEDAPKPDPSMAERFARIKAEYEAQYQVYSAAVDKAATDAEASTLYAKLHPKEVDYCRRMLELATTAPADPAARDALVWVVDKPGMSDGGPYGDEFARAAALLVRHHGDDPEAVRVGLQLDNLTSANRDALLTGFLATAKGREAKGMARLAWAQYLDTKVMMAIAARTLQGRNSYTYQVPGDDGKPVDKRHVDSDADYAYQLLTRLLDPETLRAEAERLYEEVIADYGDVPYLSLNLKRLVALVAETSPTFNGRPMTAAELSTIRAKLARKRTLGSVAEGRLDEARNLAVGKVAPQIDGEDLDGKPLTLSAHRGKVVVLVFWGSWCGPCMAAVPHERELAERLKGRPFALLGVDCNEPRAAALKAVAAERMTWPSWFDGDGDGKIAGRYHVRHYPTTFVLDGQGVIRGKDLEGQGLDKLVDELMAGVEAKAAKP